MTFVYSAVAIAAGFLGPSRLQHVPNVQRESCLSDEDEFLLTRLSAIVCIFIGYQGSRFLV